MKSNKQTNYSWMTFFHWVNFMWEKEFSRSTWWTGVPHNAQPLVSLCETKLNPIAKNVLFLTLAGVIISSPQSPWLQMALISSRTSCAMDLYIRRKEEVKKRQFLKRDGVLFLLLRTAVISLQSERKTCPSMRVSWPQGNLNVGCFVSVFSLLTEKSTDNQRKNIKVFWLF